jgi:DnaJ domain
MTMSDETYYTVLNVKETASAAEIKTAYRDLIKQVHPDTIATLAPYLRKIAEDKAKEITEAYGVLSNSSKRRDYDNQLRAYRRQSAPQAPPTSQAPPTPPPQQPSQCPFCGRRDGGHSAACANSRTSQTTSTSSGPYCNTCGTSLYASGYCPRCSKFATPAATTQKPATTPKVIRLFGYNWGPLLDWAGEYPLMVVFLFLVGVFSIGALFSDTNTQSSSSSSATSSASPAPVRNNAKAASTGPYSAYPCDYREKVSSIDGKPCKEKQNESVPAPPPGFTVVSEEPARSKPTVLVSGTYIGTVHNKTVNLSSTVTAVFHQSKTGVLEGCVQVKPPLYGSGTVQGTVRGAYVNFTVADIAFHGDAFKDAITGAYVVSRNDGNQLGDFRLTKQTASNTSYVCTKGEVTKFEVVDAAPTSQQFSDVPSGYKVLPPAPNSRVETPNAPAIVSKPPAETRASLSKQPDLSGLTYSERQSIQAACSHAKYMEGPAAYDQCLSRQLQAWEVGPKEPNLSALTYTERQSIQAACSHAKYMEGPAAYDRCLIRQFEAWTTGPKEPDLSGLTPSERQSIQSACSHAKYMEGPAAYDRCLVKQLQALTNYRQ